jgi:hypothetical protein
VRFSLSVGDKGEVCALVYADSLALDLDRATFDYGCDALLLVVIKLPIYDSLTSPRM